MIRMISLFLVLILVLVRTGPMPAVPPEKKTPAPAWRVVSVKRTNTILIERKILLGGEKEFLVVIVAYTPRRVKGNTVVIPRETDFEVVNEEGKTVGRPAYFSSGRGRNVLQMVFRDRVWSSLKGLSLKGPGNRLSRLGPPRAGKK